MPNEVIEVLKVITRSLEIVGAGLLVVGFVVTTYRWIRQSFHEGMSSAGEGYRQALARTVLIGLEVLVAATILKTITLESTVESMSFLAIMVAIRTPLGWTVVLEMTGRWPWQKPRPDAEQS